MWPAHFVLEGGAAYCGMRSYLDRIDLVSFSSLFAVPTLLSRYKMWPAHFVLEGGAAYCGMRSYLDRIDLVSFSSLCSSLIED
ncbi:hypothetical protein INT46_011062 [Mucor plumbeus]|uniref:Uncharacterized protein n=1 Tax=Mucor plumbeus TaxID=97098 RepID=A0A8H7QUQ0_9FUNG|nr:hypothetical protein INT46_011062 [Mucor plumbeus]